MLKKIKMIYGIILSLLFTVSGVCADPIKIAIANYGPHPTLQETIQGLKDGLTKAGYPEGTAVIYDISDVNFDATLIPQMLSKLVADKPRLIVALSTPVAQAAKYKIKDIPIVFSAITDPVQAKLLKNKLQGIDNLSGASDQPDLIAFLQFSKTLLPQAKTIGLLYSSSEDNDHALVEMMAAAAKAANMTVMALPIDNPEDIPLRTQQFKDKVDLIYVGTSGLIQPSLPAIVAVADSLKIPVFSADESAAKNDEVFGSFAVSYHQVGLNTADIVVRILKGEKPGDITPIYPSFSNHQGLVSRKKAEQLGIFLPSRSKNITTSN